MTSDRQEFENTIAATSGVRAFAHGRYVTRRLLGAGAQKQVFLVYDSALDRECALALFAGEKLDAEAVTRLQREAAAMGRVGSHRNIVTVFSLGEEEELPFVVCEYVSGGDLRQCLRQSERGALPVARAIQIAIDMASGIAAAHAHGVIHRDVKPANILLASDGTAKIGDFGLASAIDRSRITQTGGVLGTATYMAPEQALGAAADHRSDLYSLGAVLYELTTGRPPFLGDDPLAVISQHVHTAPVTPSWHNSEVSPALDALIISLLAKAPEDRPQSALDVVRALRLIQNPDAAADEGSPPVTPPATDLHGLDWGRFAGRRDELAQLKQVLGDVVSGHGRIVLIAGEPGIGKTRLAEEFGVYARLRGAQLLSGRCDESSWTVPYRPFIEALRQYALRRGDDTLRHELGAGAPEIAALVSEIRGRFADVRPSQALEGDIDRLRLFDSVTQFLRNAAATTPLVVFLDDLQWADDPSLLLLCHLARETAGDRILLLATYRDVEVGARQSLGNAIAMLRREQSFERIALAGLSQTAVGEMLPAFETSGDQQPDGESIAEVLFRETEGNPFFLREVVSHLVEEGTLYRSDGHWVKGEAALALHAAIPTGVREVVGKRFDRLSEHCRSLLRRASALGGGFSWPVLEAISDENDDTVLDALDEALAAQLISERLPEQPGLFDFTHGLIRQALYGELSAPRKIFLHRRIGSALEQLYSTNIEAHTPELAHHFCEAARGGGDTEKAVTYSRQAAGRAIAQYAHEDAILQLLGALEALDGATSPHARLRAEVLIDLGEAMNRAGEMAAARARFEQAYELISDDEPDLVAAVAIGLEPIPGVAGVVDEYLVNVAETALQRCDADDHRVRARLLEVLARALGWSPDTDRRIALSREAIDIARRSGDPDVLMRVLNSHRDVIAGPAFTEERLAVAREGAGLAEELHDAQMHLQFRCWELVEHIDLGFLHTTRTVIEQLSRAAEELKQPQFFWYLSVFESMKALAEGRFPDAEPHINQGLTRGQKLNGGLAFQIFGMQLFALRLLQGRTGEVLGAVKVMSAQYPALSAVRAVVALACVDVGAMDEAREQFEVLAQDDFTSIPVDSTWLMTLSLLSQVCAELGDKARAASLYKLILPYATRNVIAGDAVLSNGSVQRYLGNLAAAMEMWPDAADHFEESLRANSEMGQRPFVALTAYEFAQALLSTNETGVGDRAQRLLEQSREIAGDVGMHGVLRRCDLLEGA